MPYNPQISYTGDRALYEGISQGAGRLRDALLGLLNQSDETKSMRKELDTVDPSAKDQHAQMTLSELHGKAMGLHLKDQMQTSSLNNALSQARLDDLHGQAGSESAMSKAMQQALPPTTTTTTDLQGNPAQGANPFTVNVDSRRQMQPNDLMKAIAANPQAINSPAGRQALNDWMKQSMSTQRGAPQFMKGPDGTTWAYNQFTGQFEPSPVDKINATAAAKLAARPEKLKPGAAPTMSHDGKFFWDEGANGGRGGWKPVPQGRTDLFNSSGSQADSGGVVRYTYDNGKLVQQGTEPTD